MKNLQLFETKSQHDAIYNGNGYEEPWVAYIENDELVMYNKLHDYSKDYFTIQALEEGNVYFKYQQWSPTTTQRYMEYSKDHGETWVRTSNVNNKEAVMVIPMSKGEIAFVRGDNDTLASYYESDATYYNPFFYSDIKFNVYGNIMSLIHGNDFVNETTVTNNMFESLFCDYRSLDLDTTRLECLIINAENLILPATTLAEYCYQKMFRYCTLLTTAPKLPATTLAEGCYYEMFADCTTLTIAPELLATTLVNECYTYMFEDCTSLNYIKAMFTTTPSSRHTYDWVKGVASTGTFVMNDTAEWYVTGSNGIPTGWTVKSIKYPIIAELYFDDYPNNNRNNVWNDYDDIVARNIEDPEGMGCNKMVYRGQTIEIDGQIYYIWDYDENDSMKILTNTIDPNILTSQSLAANYQKYVGSGNTVSKDEQNLVNNITFDSLYGAMMNDSLYETGYDNTWVQSQRLVKYVKLY